MVLSTSEETIPSMLPAEWSFNASAAHWQALEITEATFSAHPDFAPSQIIPETEAVMLFTAYRICSRAPPCKYTKAQQAPIEEPIPQPQSGELSDKLFHMYRHKTA